MAKVTHEVLHGETLQTIADNYGTTVTSICRLNNILDPMYIYVGQILTISGETASSSDRVDEPSTNTVTITHFGLLSSSDRTIFAAWNWDKNNTRGFRCKWWYDLGNGVWFVGSDQEEKSDYMRSQYTPPEKAVRVSFSVQPISETYRYNNQEVSYWTAEWSTAKEYYIVENPPKTPSAPHVEINEYTLTVSLENIEINATEVEFEIIQNDSTIFNTGLSSIVMSSASYSCIIAVGNKYKVRCRGKRDSVYGPWSGYSSNVESIPSSPYEISEYEAISDTSVKISWPTVMTAKTYDIEYAIKEEYLGSSNATNIINSITSTTYIIAGLSSGETYFVRVRAVNDKGASSWSEVKTISIGYKPSAPTTWTLSSSAMVNDLIYLYWVHNARDNSKEREAKIEVTIDGESKIIEVPGTEETEENRYYVFDTFGYPDGTRIEWRVSTKGAVDEWSDWSIKRIVNVYAPPIVSLNLLDLDGNSVTTLETFPFYITASTAPNTQTPITYHISITSNDSYQYINDIGDIEYVSANDEVYSNFFDIGDDLRCEISASDVDLKNNMSYTIKCTVNMNSGLSAESLINFKVGWKDNLYSPNAEIIYDRDSMSVHIRPYCDMRPMIFYEVQYQESTGKFYRRDKLTVDVSGSSISDSYTEIYNDIVYYGKTSLGDNIYFCMAKSSTTKLVENVTLSVYRREYNGGFIEIGSGIANTNGTFVTDPHPPLDYAHYRIVASSDLTGTVSYTDIPGLHIGEKAVIIQWDETYDNFVVSGEGVIDTTVRSGSMLKLPYNIDISDNNSADISLIEYVGRSHPVSYYGTQLGISSTWKVDIDKNDRDTLYKLRKLSVYMGDVYVREPSGSGYWASIKVSYSQKHNDPVIPVTLSITRVEGGV